MKDLQLNISGAELLLLLRCGMCVSVCNLTVGQCQQAALRRPLQLFE